MNANGLQKILFDMKNDGKNTQKTYEEFVEKVENVKIE